MGVAILFGNFIIFAFATRKEMTIALYLLIILIVGGYSLVKGFRNGITGQLATLLGFAFGAVAARVLTPEMQGSFEWVKAVSPAPEFNAGAISLVCGSTIYFVTYCLFSILSGLLRGAMSVFEIGMFNRLLGAFFCGVKNLLWVSIALNFLICFTSPEELLRLERANDGNPVSAVMDMTSAILGCYGADDFSHLQQLREAKKISCNFNGRHNVIMEEGVA